MKLFKSVEMGLVINRFENATVGLSELKKYPMITLQELSYNIGESAHFEESRKVSLPFTDEAKYVFAKNGDLVLSLTSLKAMIISEKETLSILPSNFVKVHYDVKKIYGYYLMWLFNENRRFQNLLSSHVRVGPIQTIPVKELRDLSYDLPEYQQQELIGNVYKKELELLRKTYKHKKIVLEYLNELNKTKGMK